MIITLLGTHKDFAASCPPNMAETLIQMGEEEQVYAENKIKIVKEIFDLCQVKSSREKVHKLRKGFLLEINLKSRERFFLL